MNDTFPVKLMRLSPHAVLPRYAHDGDSGMDLAAAIDIEIIIPNGSRLRIPTGWAAAIPRGYEGQVRGRSSLNAKGMLVPLGTIDANYRGEISVVLLNLSGEPYWVHPGDRIAQLVIAPVACEAPVVVTKLDPTERGAGGFGSTGR